MKTEITKERGIKAGIAAGFPIFIGYFPVAIAFGILTKATVLSAGDSLAFSVLVFAGASQFMALNLIDAGPVLAAIAVVYLIRTF